MRFSLRKVVKYAIFLIIVVLLNIWISYSVTIWTFEETGSRGKVSKSLKLRVGPNSHGVDDEYDLDFVLSGKENDQLIYQRRYNKKRSLSQNRRRTKAANYFDSEVAFRSVSKENDSGNEERPVQQVGGQKSHTTKRLSDVNRSKHRNIETNTHNISKQTGREDIHVSVKTTLKYHKSRVKLLLQTWFRLASGQTFFFTDGDDDELSEILGSHLINTNCTTDHSRRALSCKMAVEFDYYLASRKRWFCHVDDDVYINIPQLINLLQKYDHREDWYLGKPSLKHPLEVADRENPGMKLAFWFATGGAGFCISRSLALKMVPYAGGGRFMTTAERIRLPDDCTLGYIIEYLLKQRLTVIDEFHSHLEALSLIKPHMLKDQITFSFSEYSNKKNVINVPGFGFKDDPTRLKSLHCHLFPTFRECRGLNR